MGKNEDDIPSWLVSLKKRDSWEDQDVAGRTILEETIFDR